jgi:hypothetical protein
MPRLFHRDEWFDELSPNALSEGEFESLLIQNADIIRADATIVPFKKTVYGGDGSARADLAIVSRDYRDWVVVEVEMARHDLYHHVVPQVRTLREAAYTQEYVDYLLLKHPAFEADKLRDMLRGAPPDVLVLVNKPDDEWRRELRRYDAHMMVFEIFRSLSNKHIFVIDGEPPRLAHSFLTELSFSNLLPRCLLVSSPATLTFKVGEKVPILVEEQLTFWERFHTATDVFLTPVASMPISPGRKYALVQMESGQLVIRPLTLRG